MDVAKFTIRAVMIVIIPIAVIWSFAATLAREIFDAFGYAKNAAMLEIETFRREWNNF